MLLDNVVEHFLPTPGRHSMSRITDARRGENLVEMTDETLAAIERFNAALERRDIDGLLAEMTARLGRR
jgi:hypothetical protein